jgi:photosystem II stability/assembly factor-like uncharacterized protein
MSRKLACITLACVLLLTFVAAAAQARHVGAPSRVSPSLGGVNPTHGIPGATVTLTGSGFGVSQGSSGVLFGHKTGPFNYTGAAATIFSWSDTTIVCAVAEIEPQALSIFVRKVTPPVPPYMGSIAMSNPIAFTVDVPPPPEIFRFGGDAVTPLHGLPAASVDISGDGFGAAQGSSSVKFGTTAAPVLSWSARSIRCQVPNMAVGFTAITVTRFGQTSNAKGFTVDAPGPGWTPQVSGTTQSLNGVSFPDASHGWAVGNGGTILATSNGGTTWTPQVSGTTQNLYSVSFPDAMHGWAVGMAYGFDVGGGSAGYPTILATSNGGATWTLQTGTPGAYPAVPFYSVCFPDALHGWAVGYRGNILATSNGGASWTSQDPGHHFPPSAWPDDLRGVSFPDASHGWAVGTQGGLILATSDGGATPWVMQIEDLSGGLNSVSFPDALHGWTVGYSGDIFVTSNGGTNWQGRESHTSLELFSVSFPDAVHGRAVGEGGVFVATDDGGGNWTPQSSGTTWTLNSVCFPAPDHGWAVGENGTIIAIGGGELPDATPPVTTAAGADALWHNHPVPVTFTATDEPGGSGMSGGLAKTEYRLDGGAWTTGSSITVPAPASHAGDGVHALAYRSSDAAGNLEAVKSVSVKIDTTPPMGSMLLNGGAASTLSALVSAGSAVSDANSVADMRFSLDAKASWSAWAPYAAAAPLTLPGGVGTKIVWAQYRDPAGNLFETSDEILLSADITPPVTTVSGVPEGWSRVPVTVTLSAVDPAPDASGVAATAYRLQGAAAWTTYAAPLTVSAQGTSVYECRSTDNAGNVEAAKTFTVRIDAGAPTTVASGVPAGWSNVPVTVTLTATDALSGVAASAYRLLGAASWTSYGAPFTVSAQGTSVYEYRSTDNAGNVEATKTFTVRIDGTAPATTASGVPAGWSNVPVTVTLSAVDPGPDASGVATTEYRLLGAAAWTSYAAPFTAGAEGTSVYEYRATDNAGNVEATQTFTVRIDVGAPTTVASGVPAGWSSVPVTVTLAATDALSGVAATEYRLLGAASWTSYAAPVTVSAEGTSVYEYRSTDNAGNVEATQSITVRILAKPLITRLSPTSGKRAATVTITGTGFGDLRAASTVRFGATACTKYLSWSDVQIKCKVPAKAKLGTVQVTVTTAGGTSNAVSFRVKRLGPSFF